MPEKVAAGPELQQKLAAANGLGVDLVDESGRVIGHALTPEQHRWLLLQLDKAQISDEELDRRAAEALTSPHTMADVLRLVRGQ